MDTIAVLLRGPEDLGLERLDLTPPGEDDVVVAVEWSGISTGTERLLWSGRMPHFPGMGYPLVPGYELVGRVTQAGASRPAVGERVFVPGARCFGRCPRPVRRCRRPAGGARRARWCRSTTAWASGRAAGAGRHRLPRHRRAGASQPDLIIGHGVLGRLLARLAIAAGAPPPTVWKATPTRRDGAEGYRVVDPAATTRRDYRAICDVSGDPSLLDTLIARLAPGGEICLAGFYAEPLSFAFPPAFMREARLRIAAEWKAADLLAVQALLAAGRLSLDGLITHAPMRRGRRMPTAPPSTDAGCLKMILDWRDCA